MIDGIIGQIRSRLFDYKGSPKKLQLSNADHLAAAMRWFKGSLRSEGGVSASYSLVSHTFLPGYPAGTATWIPILHRLRNNYPELYSSLFGEADLAHELMNWVLLTQRRDGTFPGSHGDFMNQPPVVFRNGQIIQGLLDYHSFAPDDRLLDACRNAAFWLVKVQSPDGSWRQFTYNQLSSNTITAAALMRLATITGDSVFHEAGERNIDFSLSLQNQRGYFTSNGFDPGPVAFSLTLAYAISGILEAFILRGNPEWKNAVIKAMDSLCEKVGPKGFLVGEMDESFGSSASFACLPGNCLLAISGYKLASVTGNKKYLDTADRLTGYVKEKQLRSRDHAVNGAISGSWPISGNYRAYEIGTTGVKYFVEAILLQDLMNG